MTSEDQLISLRRRRGYCGGRFTYLSTRLDEYEQSGSQQNSLLTNYEKQLTEVASQFEAIQLELEVLDEKEQVRGFEIRDQYVAVDTRLQNLLRNAQTASPSTSINPPTCASSASLNPIVIKLPDLRLPTFGGSLEKWNTFYDTLSSQSTNDESAAGRESASLKLPENHFPGHNAKTPPSPLPQGPTDKGSNNDLNKTRNAIQTPPTEKIASTRTPTSPRVTRNSLHNTSSVSPTRDLTTTKFASSLSQQSDLTLPNALNQKTRPIRNSSYHTRNVSLKRGLTTTTLASSGTEQSESTLLITLNLTSFNEPLGLKKERVSPGDKSFQKLISHNLLQNVHDSLTAVHNLDSNGLNPIQDSKVNVESKPTGKASKSTVITPSRGSFSSGNTSTMDVQHNVSTSNHLSYITSSAPPETRNIASDSHTPRRNVKTPPSPPQRGAMPASGPTQNNFRIINTTTNHSNDRRTERVTYHRHLNGVTRGSKNANILSNTKASHSHDVQRSFSTEDHH
ncbi:uncharacterized protein LOC143303045 isoform X2 [Bombus vancouverensis nearcticus]|uniref:uncharacterized protein LOC143303045 isoform X2 n=1 Tax=Bombus vancouverensis nearcticus TaxID=2705178 RepID=UPI00402BBBF4